MPSSSSMGVVCHHRYQQQCGPHLPRWYYLLFLAFAAATLPSGCWAFSCSRTLTRTTIHKVVRINSNMRKVNSVPAPTRASIVLSSFSPRDVDDEENDGSKKQMKTTTGSEPSSPKLQTTWSAIESLPVQTLNKENMMLGDVLTDIMKHCSNLETPPVALSCLSHYGDYNAWEMTQQYMSAIKSGRLSEDCPVVLVGIGSVDAAETFAADIGLSTDPVFKNRIVLVTDETGSVTEALDCYQGWLTVDKKHKEKYSFTDVRPAIKLLGMIFGLGSPGTIENVIQGYTGDAKNNHGIFGRQWVIQALKQGSEKGRFPQVDVSLTPQSKLKPFELATLRLQTGLHIVTNWGKLGPKDGDLFTRMGGTFMFQKKNCIFEHFDVGILNFANMDDICLVAEAAIRGERYIVPANKAEAEKNRQNLWARKDKEAIARLAEADKEVEKARLEEVRLAMEAKLAKEARIEELDRMEAERIAEMARQGEEAKRAREAELAAEAKAKQRLAEDARKQAIETKANQETEQAFQAATEAVANETEAEQSRKAVEENNQDGSEQSVASNETLDSPPATSNRFEDDLDMSVDEILMRAEEQEKKIRESLEAIQNVQKASRDIDESRRQEKFQRSLLATRIKHGKGKERTMVGMIINGASAPAQFVPEIYSDQTIVKQHEEFQRRLLAAQLKYHRLTSNSIASFEASGQGKDDADSQNIIEVEEKEQRVAFQRELLAARIHYDKSSGGKSQSKVTVSTVHSQSNVEPSFTRHESSYGVLSNIDKEEMFHRSLLEARLKYENPIGRHESNMWSNRAPTKITKPYITPDQAML